MCIECASSPIHLKRWIGSGLKLDYNIIHDLREITPTMRFLACSLAWLFMACACYIASFYSALAVTLGKKKEVRYLKAEKSGAAWSNKIIPMVSLCYFAVTYTHNLQCYMSGTSLRTPSSIVLVG